MVETALVQEEQPTFRAYLLNTLDVRTALAKRDLYLIDAEPLNLSYGQAFQLLIPPVAMGDLGSFRLELKEME